MFRNFFKTAIRNLSKNKFFAALNVIGLALGMSLSLLFIALLAFLYRFDDFHPNASRIYRVTTHVLDKDENPRYASAPAPLAQVLARTPGVEKVVCLHRSLYNNAVYNGKSLALRGYYADADFFEVFNFPMVQGNKATALREPNSLVLTETEAKKLFGAAAALGEIVTLEGSGDFLVTGIVKDLPANTHFQFGALASYPVPGGAVQPPSKADWTAFEGSYVYFLLSKNGHVASMHQTLQGEAARQYRTDPIKASFNIQGLRQIVPGPELWDAIGPSWSYLLLFITGAITLVVLIPACANYVNLSIAQSLERMKEIGVRKVMGSGKRQIILQFVVESTTITLLALLLSYAVYNVIRDRFLSQMVETSPMDLAPTWLTIAGFVLFALLVGAVAGLVPGMYFSKINTTVALKGKELKTSRRSYLRKVILTVQFVISLGFTMAVIITLQQYRYSVNYNLGFNQKQILDVTLANVDPQRFKTEFETLPQVQRVSLSSHVLGLGASDRFVRTSSDSVAVASMAVDASFVENLNLKVIAGTNFSVGASANARAILVNEAFVKQLQLGTPAAALHQLVTLSDSSVYRVAGVLQNFHYAGLKEIIGPFFLEYAPAKATVANIKLASSNTTGSLAAMETLWQQIGGTGPFTARLFSEEIKASYGFYVMVMKLWGFLGLLAITVACLGLLGTVSFTIKKRVKEIGIRKVLGASVHSLVLLLSKDFAWLLGIAAAITTPVMYFMFTHLLHNTQYYSIHIGVVEVGASVLLMLVLGLGTILSQTIRSASANPVRNLRVD